jgi:hypothetical protein
MIEERKSKGRAGMPGAGLRGVRVLVLETLYLFAPLLLASAISGVVLRFDLLRALRRPIDGGLRWRGRRLFGDSKTWRGVVVAIAGCVAGVAIQTRLAGTWPSSLALVDYGAIDPWSFGAAMGAGAMLGELPNSFTKRRRGIPPGGTSSGPSRVLFYVWDQVDLLIGAWPLLAWWVRPDLGVLLTSFALALTVHPVVSLVGYLVGARKTAR